ncbi:MAG: nucleotidyl transferase AbiEii/AbiGii toxin family protein [Thermoplasmata archaeon]|nr:MAG: nucleotidyl transferase AbiEii/AbiGii toxin family protein [Thermoplasmata archaeon]
MRLHNILSTLSKNEFFNRNFLFKGGTCLIKSYLGYFRFSEDIDFTWQNQEIFNGMSQNSVRKYLSKQIDITGKIFEEMKEDQGFEFVMDKGNERYVELGGSNKTATFKLWYDSEILNYPTFIKVQFNFVELLKYPMVQNELHSLISNLSSEKLDKFFPQEYDKYSSKISFRTYDIREILCEKVRAILTRMGIKARDFVDAYLIVKKVNEDISKYKPQIKEKTIFTLDMYEKYRSNLKRKTGLINSKELFKWGLEKELLLKEFDEIEFSRFVNDFSDFIIEIVDELD